MKPRRNIAAAGGAIALVLLFAALPMLASTDSVANFVFAEDDTENNYWVFSWDTATGEDTIKFQLKGGGISSLWVSVRQQKVERDKGKTELSITPLNLQSGSTAQFRVSVKSSSGWTNWAETSVNADDV